MLQFCLVMCSCDTLTTPYTEMLLMQIDITVSFSYWFSLQPTILVTDPDSGAYGRSTFSLSGIGSDNFYVTTTGDKVAVVAVAGLLDRETVASYNLVLSAVDGVAHDGIQFTATTQLSITIQDVNDNAPVFDRVNNVTIREEEDAGFVATVRATDEDAGSNGRVTYTMSGGRGYFTVDEDNGMITTTQKIDRETYANFDLNVIASDSGTASRTAATSFTVHIQDINDNDPVLLGVDDANLYENTDCSEPIVNVSATDPDQSQSVSLSTTNPNFQIDSSGYLRCKSSLDYEVKQSHSVTIMATDNGQFPRSTNKTMIVSVKDVNDNAPQFSAVEYTTNVSTAELRQDKPVIVVDAKDLDSGSGGKITFSLSDNPLFYVESVNNVGVVRVKEDGGKVGSFSMNIYAVDHGTPPLSNETTITITVASASDVVQFVANDFNFTVLEGKRDTTVTIGRVNSTYDSSQISVLYELPGSSLFSIKRTTGELVCGSLLDREVFATHQIVVRVYSTSNREDGDVALITVNVEDINDNDPQFKNGNQTRELELPENRPHVGVVNLTATDPDEGQNGKITYSLKESNLPFQIVETTGEITSYTKLDYEIIRTYTFTVEALDGGNPRRSASVSVIVHVTDENDNPPVFEQSSYTATVSESSVFGKEVLFVLATDRDSGSNSDLQYVIVNTTTSKYCSFSISNEVQGKKPVGKLTVGGQLDRESAEVCTVKVIVYDSLDLAVRLSATATVTISVQDVNDNQPMFVGRPYNVTILRDIIPGHVIFDESTIVATDRDAGQNGEVKYSLSGVGSGYFQITASSGQIAVIKSLEDAPDFIYLALGATDGGVPPRIASTHVAINISDDNPRPWFPKSYTFTVVEEAQPVTFTERVQAQDRTSSGVVTCDCHYQLATQSREWMFTEC
ncbi:cadherin-23-like [Gigantopelta aegis]|uniref:cadherin-23-like n=1 Tax=Gigantopelta aegis TaxID=1735272 RepID=UPI001B88CDE0|nr:cadherin-23-like [Gigantopelta aegis]